MLIQNLDYQHKAQTVYLLMFTDISSDAVLRVSIGLASCLTVVTWCVFGEELRFIYNNFGHNTTKTIRYGVLLGLYPVTSHVRK